MCKYFDPFPPDTFEKTFIKRNTKLNESKEEVIENSLGGLSQYFTAPNIRNKVKHPVFLAAKFSNCVRLFCNVNLLKMAADKNNKEEDMIQVMQKILMENGYKEKGDAANSNKAFDNKYFILLIEEPNNLDSFQLNKKVLIFLCILAYSHRSLTILNQLSMMFSISFSTLTLFLLISRNSPIKTWSRHTPMFTTNSSI